MQDPDFSYDMDAGLVVYIWQGQPGWSASDPLPVATVQRLVRHRVRRLRHDVAHLEQWAAAMSAPRDASGDATREGETHGS